MGRSVAEATIAIGRIRAMPFGRARVEAAARQVRLIEAEGPDEVRAYALESLIEALTWTGESQRALGPFIQLLRWWDAHPEHFDTGDQNILFWEFGWIVNDLCRNPDAPETQVEAILDDMERRFSLASRGMEKVWSCRLDWELLRGGEDLERTFSTWLTMPLDDEDSCPACHQEHHAEYLVETGDLEGAVAVMESAISAQLGCSREPASMLALLAWCKLELGREEEVEELMPQVLAELRAATSLSVSTAYALLFEVFGRGRDVNRAVEVLDKIAESMSVVTPYVRLETLRHVVVGVDCLESFGLADEPISVKKIEQTTLREYGAWALSQAQDLSERFDRRHSCSIQADRLRKARDTTPATRALDFGATTSGRITEVTSLELQESVTKAGGALARAEAYYKKGDHHRAITAYHAAGEEAIMEGRLMEAGWCWAEAARHAQEIDKKSATKDYLKAHALLKAAGVSLEDISVMFIAWAPDVQHPDYATFKAMALQEYPTPAKLLLANSIEEVVPDFFNSSIVASPLLRRYYLARAELRDCVARVMATWGDDADLEEAQAMAEESASRFSTLGRTDQACHGWWLAGRIAARRESRQSRHSIDSKVEVNYSLALEGFLATGTRSYLHGAAAAGEFAAYLSEKGRLEQAEEVLAPWVEKEE